MPAPKTTRMDAADRRELVLDAATRAFARGGYAGTSTDAVAKEAGVSQPYVVRMFGTKSELFRLVFQRAIDGIMRAFDRVLDESPSESDVWPALGRAYAALVTDRDLLLVMMHGFTASTTPEIGTQARDGMSAIYTQIRGRTGCTPDEARDFIAHGMLLNCLLAIQAVEHSTEESPLAELADCAFGPKLAQFVKTSG
ncbi:TetR/AcrR family transcriptional regulator [Rhodococcus sp. RS1C4]|uniref:TetR/AcrR family transcriptional regulator n=1 Tax=Nocardiaceae TaxID=85025 RepID=UPI00037A6267|nr:MULTISPECIES: TetR/AcrR family transcriptional regulator [Rhodococcus]OZC45046.1 TetR/AcrR family transcriptional regulator [Rhodococcus sp. RS1C4]OZD05743.1 TetR/AcrR family transcriptional regulator [Rhodococcus sp. 06-156-4C]OZD16857.1 TetR/AcrR family transcriptional regulator [Rhodococcus sp. 06-156-4a]OZD26715.1 TetR/AcrR family transcriptional regulator [Rhodococcus sp. 06-156-3C]OZD32112.1 TetR/AcrR family transcriptional regulator [Rhodococcus sp. 06-156-3b]